MNWWTEAEKPGQQKFQVYKVIALFQDSIQNGMTAMDLADELGIHLKTAVRHLRELWTLDLIYISDWDRNWNMPVPVFRWGSKTDKPRPLAKTNAKKTANYRTRKKNNDTINHKERRR